MTSIARGLATALVLMAVPSPASAHFLWIVAGAQSPDGKVHVYFSEDASPDEPALLDRVNGAAVWHLVDGKPHALKTEKGTNSLVADPGGAKPRLFGLSHSLGVLSRGNSAPFLLNYHAKCLTSSQPSDWATAGAAALPLEIVPRWDGQKIVIRSLFQGKPSTEGDVVVSFEGSEDLKGKTNAAGEYSFELPPGKLASIRVRHVDATRGELEGKPYDEIRHYSTLTLAVAKDAKVAMAPLEPGLTSFGAAIVGRNLYIYGGHKGGAHSYSDEEQSSRFARLNLENPAQWEEIGTIPRRAGTALVAHGGKLYRIGGFEAMNKKGEKDELHSRSDFTRFDPATGKWEDLAPLPAGRSSHDAVVSGDKLYVVGGWELKGEEKSVWHETALVADLSAETISWQEIPVPFRRRALSLGEWKGKIVAIGGMQESGGPTRRTSIYDPAAKSWADGPELQGEAMDGFGSSAFLCGDDLYATTFSGKLQRLSNDGEKWEVIGQLGAARFFHRMLTTADGKLLIVGGANMKPGGGKILELELIDPNAPDAKQAANR